MSSLTLTAHPLRAVSSSLAACCPVTATPHLLRFTHPLRLLCALSDTELRFAVMASSLLFFFVSCQVLRLLVQHANKLLPGPYLLSALLLIRCCWLVVIITWHPYYKTGLHLINSLYIDTAGLNFKSPMRQPLDSGSQ